MLMSPNTIKKGTSSVEGIVTCVLTQRANNPYDSGASPPPPSPYNEPSNCSKSNPLANGVTCRGQRSTFASPIAANEIATSGRYCESVLNINGRRSKISKGHEAIEPVTSIATMTGFFDSVEICCLGSMIFSFGPAFFSYVRGPEAAALAADAARAGAAAGAYAYLPDPYHFEVSSSHEYMLSP